MRRGASPISTVYILSGAIVNTLDSHMLLETIPLYLIKADGPGLLLDLIVTPFVMTLTGYCIRVIKLIYFA